MKKRFISLLLALSLCLGLLPMAATAAGSGFDITDGVLTRYRGPGGDVVIPAGVTEIGDNAFRFCYDLTSITIPDNVTKIDRGAFTFCTGLTSVAIPDSVTEISDSVFTNCYNLTSVTIPGSVTKIGGWAFTYCISLTSVTIPDSVTEIGEWAFSGCTGLTSVTIPNSVTEIGEWAFNGCTGLTSVTIPDSVTEIGRSAFHSCTGLTSVIIPDSVTEISNSAFRECTGLTSVTIPDSVTEIGYSAFEGCTGLTSVTIPDSVTRIGDSAFRECTGLTSVTIPDSVTEISHSAFSECTSLTIYGVAGSAAEKHANAYKIPFAAIDGSTEPAAPVEPPEKTPVDTSVTSDNAASTTAYPSTQTVNVDGRAVEFQCYALKDAAGNDTNYIKLRDLAAILNGTAARFEVGWDGDITITTGKAYTPNGSEQNTPFSGQRGYEKSAATTQINGVAADLDAIVLKDDNGGGYTYYQLRDLGKALGFNVGWTAERGMFLETDKPYNPAD